MTDHTIRKGDYTNQYSVSNNTTILQATQDKYSQSKIQTMYSMNIINRNLTYILTSCVANMRTVLSENRRSQRLKRSSRVEPSSSITRALYLLHWPKCSTFGMPSAHYTYSTNIYTNAKILTVICHQTISMLISFYLNRRFARCHYRGTFGHKL